MKAMFTYREFVPTGDLPLDVNNLEFCGNGNLVELLNRAKRYVQYDRSWLADEEIGFINKRRGKNQVGISALQQEIAELKKSNRFAMLHSNNVSAQEQELSALLDKEASMEDKIYLLETDERFYTPKQLANRFAKMLRELNFESLKTKINENGVAHEELVCSLTDEQLKVDVEVLISELDKKFQQDRRNLFEKYGEVFVPVSQGSSNPSDVAEFEEGM